MNAKLLSKLSSFLTVACIGITSLFQSSCSDIWQEQHPGTYYTFTGYTIASRLESQPEFSKFVEVLKRANIWAELSTYGHYTCFAPYNECIDEFIAERAEKYGKSYKTVADLPYEDCDTLARTHLVDITCFVGEMEEGDFPKTNMNERYLILSFDPMKVAVGNDSITKLRRCVNSFSHIVMMDDTCENGVIHTIDRCIDFTGNYIYDLVDPDKNPDTKIFYQALKKCGLTDILNQWNDDNYKIGDDSVYNSNVKLSSAGKEYIVSYWAQRKICFTMFVETDSVFHKCGINDIDGLIHHVDSVYRIIYPEDAAVTDFTDRRNYLNRFISYHILPFAAGHDNFNMRKGDIMNTYNAGVVDPEDFFETLAPHTLMRISTARKQGGGVYINRRGVEGNGSTMFNRSTNNGVKILTVAETKNTTKGRNFEVNQTAKNGYMHYIDTLLIYDNFTKNDLLDRRIRIDCATLSPDFITSQARQKPTIQGDSQKRGFGFKNPTNFKSIAEDYVLSVRPVNTSDSYAYEGDGIDIQGNFDMYIKLPPVPFDGTWQLRLSFRANSACGIVQSYMAEMPDGAQIQATDWVPLGLPADLRVDMADPTVGWISDEDLEEEDGEEAIDALDKSMKNRGWMKGPDTQLTATGSTHRNIDTMGRKILSTGYMKSDMNYYLRIKQVLDGNNAEFLFDYIELVPKDVYDNYEDKH